jgi:Ca2+:H+ antiporter
MNSHDTAGEAPSDGQQTPTQDDGRQATRSSGSNDPRQLLSPEPVSSTTKPKMTRRASSKFQAPYKGQEFSVDDDPDEYESDYVAHRHPSQAKSASGHGHSLRRQSSTLRRRPTAQPTPLPRVDSQGEDEEAAELAQVPTVHREQADEGRDSSGEEGTIRADGENDDEDNDDNLSDAESFTLKDRQNAINETHPFGIRIWKPALYQKNRSIEKSAEGDIHSSPGGRVNRWLWMFNIFWTLLFGWWLALAAALGAVTCFVFGFAPAASDYGRVFLGLSLYLFYPFGQFVKLEQDEAYAEEDEGEGRSITEYEQWQNGDLEDGRLFFGPLTSRSLIGRRRSIDSTRETDSLLGRTGRVERSKSEPKNRRSRLFGRGEWNVGRVIFFVFFYFLLAPLLLLASGICWFMVFWIPMGKATLLLFYHLRRHPLALSFNLDSTYSRGGSSSSSVLLCTYRAVGLKYWKYTIDGTNIFLINLIGVVLFVIFDYWVLDVALGLDSWIVSPGFVFALALFSIIPLAYFIGQAVASISAQSSMGVGAAINAFFSTIVEVFLYCVALHQGKGQLVEGSIIGSIFAGILFLPGLSMCFGAIKRKTQRFNVKSAGVTSTMLLFATIAAFGPTLFYQIYGSVSGFYVSTPSSTNDHYSTN